jgi:hypothetical protein
MAKDSGTPKIIYVKKAPAKKVAPKKPEAKPEPQIIDKATFRELTDVVLKSNGVPRDYLFEYPYNEFESRKLIAKAEATVVEIAEILKIRIER